MPRPDALPFGLQGAPTGSVQLGFTVVEALGYNKIASLLASLNDRQ